MEDYLALAVVLSVSIWFSRKRIFKILKNRSDAKKETKEIVLEEKKQIQASGDYWEPVDNKTTNEIPFEEAMFIIRNHSRRNVISEDGKVYFANDASLVQTEQVEGADKIENASSKNNSINKIKNTSNEHPKTEVEKSETISQEEFTELNSAVDFNIEKMKGGGVKIKTIDSEYLVSDNMITSLSSPDKIETKKTNGHSPEKKEHTLHVKVQRFDDKFRFGKSIPMNTGKKKSKIYSRTIQIDLQKMEDNISTEIKEFFDERESA